MPNPPRTESWLLVSLLPVSRRTLILAAQRPLINDSAPIRNLYLYDGQGKVEGDPVTSLYLDDVQVDRSAVVGLPKGTEVVVMVDDVVRYDFVSEARFANA